MKKRNSFLFYYSYYDAVKELSAEEQGRMYKIIVDYAMLQIEPTLTGIEAMLFKLMKPNLDASIRKWQNGLKGGAPKGNSNAKKQPKNDQETSKKQAKNNLKTTRYIKEQEKEQEKEQKQEQELEEDFEQDNQPNNDSSAVCEKIKFLVEHLNFRVDKLQAGEILSLADANRLKELFKRVASEPEHKLNKTVMASDRILETYQKLFMAEDCEIADRIAKAFKALDTADGVRNKTKYAMGVFYNKACGY